MMSMSVYRSLYHTQLHQDAAFYMTSKIIRHIKQNEFNSKAMEMMLVQSKALRKLYQNKA